MGQTASVNASLWYRSTALSEIKQKADEILHQIKGGVVIQIDNGFFWFKVPEVTPFAQPVDSGNDTIKRILISMEVESLTAD